MQVTLNFELTDKQVKKIMKHYELSADEVQECMQELVRFVKDDPETFLENLDWFNF